MIPLAVVTAERCMHAAPPSDGGAHCKPRVVSVAQPKQPD